MNDYLVILEGPDGSGKTTLAAEVARRLPSTRSAHNSMPGYDGQVLAQQNILSLLPPLLGLGSTTLDRCWLSERIYGEVLRNGVDRLAPFSRMLLRTALSCDHLLVSCYHDVEKTWETVTGRQEVELIKKHDDLHRVHEEYTRSDFGDGLVKMLIDPRAMGLEHTVKAILSSLEMLYDDGEQETRRAWRLAGLTGAFKHLRKKTIDRPVLMLSGGPTARSTRWPFIDFSRDGCSVWLADRLEKMGVPETRLVWLNVHDLWGEPRELVGEMLVGLSSRLAGILCLGKRAEKYVFTLGGSLACPLFFGEHPQYLRRFYHDRPLDQSCLGDALRRALAMHDIGDIHAKTIHG